MKAKLLLLGIVLFAIAAVLLGAITSALTWFAAALREIGGKDS